METQSAKEILTVKNATDILKKHGLVKDVDGTRRFIRKGDLPAKKGSNYDGYSITREALDAFIWVKSHSTKDLVRKILHSETYKKEKPNKSSPPL